MKTLLTFIFFAVVFYYAFKLFARYALPWLIARFMRKQQEKFNNMSSVNQNHFYNDNNEKTATNKKKNTDKDDTDFGEYVDFEEVKD